jgi:hypothetical protein
LPTISGSISPANNGSGATVTLSGAASATTTADAFGNYSFSALGDGSYIVSPGKPGFNFSPAGQNVTVRGGNVSGVNFTAAAAASKLPTISGSITPANNGSGATVTLSGAAGATTTADASGNYNFIGLSAGSYTVTASKNGFNFSPASQNVTVSTSDVSRVNFIIIFSRSASIDILPGQDIPSAVTAAAAGTAFIIHPGTYRLTKPINPKDGDMFIGQTACAPPTTSCSAIISGSTVIGPQATFDGTNYEVTGQTQQTPPGVNGVTSHCYPGYYGCIYPEDLFFDRVQLIHLYSSTLPTIATGQWWFDYTKHIIYFHDNPSGHLVETSVSPAAFTANHSNNVTLQYLTVEEFAAPIQAGAIDPHTGQASNASPTANVNWVVDHCEVWGSHANGVHINFGTQVYNSYLHHNGQLAIGGGTNSYTINSAVIIQGNLITYNNTSYVSDQFGAGGVKFGNTLGAIIRGNTIQYNHGNGIHMDDNSSNILMDGNIITKNYAGGIYHEIGVGTASVVRNNVIVDNPKEPILGTGGYDLSSMTSTGIDNYCNLLQASGSLAGEHILQIVGGNRTWNGVQLVSQGNTFHHNTIILESVGSQGNTVWRLTDATDNQQFFTGANSIPDYNTYHLGTMANTKFAYDDNTSMNNTAKDWAQFIASGVEPHGSADTNNTSGYPTVAISSPLDQSSVAIPATITATASDPSGISKVELYVDWSLYDTINGSGPYNFSVTASPGVHTVAAMAYSEAGIGLCNAITLTTLSAPTGSAKLRF